MYARSLATVATRCGWAFVEEKISGAFPSSLSAGLAQVVTSKALLASGPPKRDEGLALGGA